MWINGGVGREEEGSRVETGGRLPASKAAPRPWWPEDTVSQQGPEGSARSDLGPEIKAWLLMISCTLTGRQSGSPLPLWKSKFSEVEGVA